MGEDDSLEGKGKKKKLVWNRFKWMIFATNTAVSRTSPPALRRRSPFDAARSSALARS